MTPGSWSWSSPSHCWKDATVRIFSVSDLHTDHKANWRRVQEWELERKEDDSEVSYIGVLIVAGDLSANLETMRMTLEFLTTLFDHVIFVPGNNEVKPFCVLLFVPNPLLVSLT